MNFPLTCDIDLFKRLPLSSDYRSKVIGDDNCGCYMGNFLVSCGIGIRANEKELMIGEVDEVIIASEFKMEAVEYLEKLGIANSRITKFRNLDLFFPWNIPGKKSPIEKLIKGFSDFPELVQFVETITKIEAEVNEKVSV